MVLMYLLGVGMLSTFFNDKPVEIYKEITLLDRIVINRFEMNLKKWAYQER